MRPEELPEIRHLHLFRDMTQANFESLMASSYAQNFPQGLEMIRQGDPADFLHIVLEGSVELFSQWSGRECTMAVVRPVSTFILAACIRDAPYLMSARTLERTRIILVPASDIRAMFRRDTEFAVSVINELAACYRSVVRNAKTLKLRNSRERVASYLLRQWMLAGGGASYILPIEKRLLASYLGMTPENLSRTLRLLEADGVKINGARVIITDHEKLTALAKPDRLIDGPDTIANGNGSGLPVT
ncbi:cyclic nucleotide-binding domain-containing protein [Roseinatronobacter alkalisoli]|uniref:Cyclic nucleotide-binding domain-containing protein n=1 Tax=Roseinatronobacter alkalisoli TaxID=3028235 RepID=A0ABT5TBL2_9RHOB|nr:cyclic nucleotide-binding domain-containing protein [Roseinatronobacter sp. HJB301]MDD7972334.1 cyclic nucleotide-binding domain-containing protein [Roseinatronobacter sp. HJB301]